ncbi:MAG: hypothetical protein IKX26_04870 [Bacteroidales bacterium]|nr:hypothetical protein [Bacteroidales bacterium]
MKHKIFTYAGLMALASLALVASSCHGGQNNNNGTEGQETSSVETQEVSALQKGIALELKNAYRDIFKVSSATFFADSIVVVCDSVPHTYIIDKEKSFESVEIVDYKWTFVVSGKGEGCPPLDSIEVEVFMKDIYADKERMNSDCCLFWNKSDAQMCYIKNDVEIPRRMFAKYPESRPFPELVMENTRFYYGYQVDSAKVPGFISAVKRVVIKDNTISFSDGEKTTTLEMVPLSDRENVYSEGYDWYFLTKETETCPGLSFNLNAGFDFERKQLKPEERWISLYIKDIGEIQFDFRSWDNLKRKISVYYPSEQEFQNTMEEGILPDCSDEEE